MEAALKKWGRRLKPHRHTSHPGTRRWPPENLGKPVYSFSKPCFVHVRPPAFCLKHPERNPVEGQDLLWDLKQHAGSKAAWLQQALKRTV